MEKFKTETRLTVMPSDEFSNVKDYIGRHVDWHLEGLKCFCLDCGIPIKYDDHVHTLSSYLCRLGHLIVLITDNNLIVYVPEVMNENQLGYINKLVNVNKKRYLFNAFEIVNDEFVVHYSNEVIIGKALAESLEFMRDILKRKNVNNINFVKKMDL